MNAHDLAHRFKHHPPTSETIELHQIVRGLCYETAEYFNEKLPDCREKSLAVTKIEEAMMWANAAIARELSAPLPGVDG